MSEVTKPLALDETLQDVAAKLGRISSVTGASAYTQAVAGGYTGTQAEFEAQIAKQPIVVNPNLLDNWYFVGGGSQQGGGQFPINQKGQTSYTPTANSYAFDLWLVGASSTTITINSDGVTVATVLRQRLEGWEQYAGKTVTLSAILNGALYQDSATIPSEKPSAFTWITPYNTTRKVGLAYDNTSGSVCFYIMNVGNAKATAAKMELGNTQTLAHNEGTDANPVWVLNEIPNYTEELWKCQRYYQIFASSSYRPTYGEDYRPPMRLHSPSKGTISIGGTTYYYADAKL